MLAKVQSGAVLGIDAYIVKVELDITEGLPYFNTVGLPDTSVKESKDRVASAIKNSGFRFPMKRITANLAPADIRKEGSAFDLPLAIAVLSAFGQISMENLDEFAILGELSMDGSIRPVKGALPIAISVRNAGITGLILPKDNVKEASVVGGINIYPAENLRQVVDFLNKDEVIAPFNYDIADDFAKGRACKACFGSSGIRRA
jgi:magnesium chelatase family protein